MRGPPRRLHVLPNATIRDAARFLTSALLLSHSTRRDTAAVVEVGGYWILAQGGRVRHLRPDQDTAEGWIRSVLRGSRLGGVVMDSPPEPVGTVVLVVGGDGSGLGSLPRPPITLCYGACPYDYNLEIVGLHEPWRNTAIINIILDRIEEWGLGGCG